MGRPAPLRHGPVKTRTGGDIGFAAQDGFDAVLFGLFVKLHGAEHVAMIGHGHRRHAEFFRPLDQFANTVRPIQ